MKISTRQYVMGLHLAWGSLGTTAMKQEKTIHTCLVSASHVMRLH